MIDKKLLDILVCPITGDSLLYDSESDELIGSKFRYKIENNIPIMLAENNCSSAAEK